MAKMLTAILLMLRYNEAIEQERFTSVNVVGVKVELYEEDG